jgi:hypothetical protein
LGKRANLEAEDVKNVCPEHWKYFTFRFIQTAKVEWIDRVPVSLANANMSMMSSGAESGICSVFFDKLIEISSVP